MKYFDRKLNVADDEYEIMYSVAPYILKYRLIPIDSPITKPCQINNPTENHQINQSCLLVILSVPKNKSKGKQN